MRSIHGLARADLRTKNLAPRLRAGEIAVIHHTDLDGLSASSLVEKHVAAVVNTSPSISGRYPNRGPSILLRAGVPLVEVSDPSFIANVRDGQLVVLTDASVRCGDRDYPARWISLQDVEKELDAARRFLGTEIEKFARNTLEYIERERHLVVDNLDIPELRTRIAGKHTVIVVRGEGFKLDLEAILPYVREVHPVLIAVDGGADALLEQGLRPDLIVGDMDSVSDEALRCGAEIVVHSYPRSRRNHAAAPIAPDDDLHRPIAGHGSPPVGSEAMSEIAPGLGDTEGKDQDGRDARYDTAAAPGLSRLSSLGIGGKLFSVAGTSEDMAMLIAFEKGAELIVAVGAHFGLVDFLDKGRAGMASTFLVRLRVGSRLVDARGVGALYNPGRSLGGAWYALVAAASVPVVALAVLSPGLRAAMSLSVILFRHWLRAHGL